MIDVRDVGLFAQRTARKGAYLQDIERRRLLGSIEILRTLSSADLDALARACSWQSFTREQQIIAYLDTSTHAHFLVCGRARIVIHSSAGKAVLLSDIEPGGVFGEIAALDGEPRSASVEAIDDCLVASLPASIFRSLLQRNPDVAIALLKTLASGIRRLDQRVLEFSTLSVRDRFLVELLRVAKSIDANAVEVMLVPAPSLLELSGRISTHREAISRELSRLSRLGIVERVSGNLRILNVPRLAEMARDAQDC